MFANPFPHAFGLDLNDLSIKVVQLRNASLLHRKPTYELSICRSTTLPHGLIVDGEIQQPEKVRKYIMHLLGKQEGKKQQDITSPWVVTALPETKSFLKRITIPKPRADILDDDVKAAAAQHLPYAEDTYYIDWQIIPCPDQHDDQMTSVLVGVTAKSIADMYTYLLESLGLGIMALEIESLSVARAMIGAQKDHTGEAHAILDIGASRTSFILYDHNSVEFSTILPFSGELLTTTLAQKLRLSYEDAEKRKIEIGLDYTQKKSKEWTVMMETVTAFVAHIKKAIQFYATHFPEANSLASIHLCGGSSNMKNLDTVLTESLGIPTAQKDPWSNLSARKPIPLTPEQSATYTTGVGLALRAADNPFFSHDMV